MADGKPLPINIYFREDHEKPLTEKCSNSLCIRDKTTGKERLLSVGQDLNVHGDSNKYELLKRLIAYSPDELDGKDGSVLDATVTNFGDCIIDVWRFPHKLTSKYPEESRSHTTSNDASLVPLSVKESPLEYLYLPSHINTVFLIGENGSGKSLFLQRFLYENEDTVHLITPSPSVAKYKSGGSQTKNVERRVHTEPVEQNIIEKLSKDDKKTIGTCFKRITEKWALKFEKINGRTCVFFMRLKDDGSPLGKFWYEEASDGLRQIFRTVLHFPSLFKYKIVCLDEPESHLHPRLYFSLVKELISHTSRNNDSLGHTKLIIATHDFHLIDTLVRMPDKQICAVIMEMRLEPPSETQNIDVKELKTTHDEGVKNQLDEPLWSTISACCLSQYIFDVKRTQESLVEYSLALLQTMTYGAPIVLFCEGNHDSIDSQIYALFFDSNKLDVQPVGGGFAEVLNKVRATKNASHLLRAKRKYYGLCDRDRNLTMTSNEVCVLPIAEVENIFWMPKMWELFPRIIKQLCGSDPNKEQKYINDTHEFWRGFRALICLNLYQYMCEYAISDGVNRTEISQPNLKKMSRINTSNSSTNAGQTVTLQEKRERMSKHLDSYSKVAESFKQEWEHVLQYAFEVSSRWETAYKSKPDLKKKLTIELKFPLIPITININDANSITTDDLVVSNEDRKYLSPKHLLYAFLQLGGYSEVLKHEDNTNDNNPGTDEKDTSKSSRPKQKHEEPSIAVTKFSTIVNEKDILSLLEESIFSGISSNELHKRKIIYIFKELLKDTRDDEKAKLREDILFVVHDLFSQVDYSNGSIKSDIMGALLQHKDGSTTI